MRSSRRCLQEGNNTNSTVVARPRELGQATPQKESGALRRRCCRPEGRTFAHNFQPSQEQASARFAANTDESLQHAATAPAPHRRPIVIEELDPRALQLDPTRFECTPNPIHIIPKPPFPTSSSTSRVHLSPSPSTSPLRPSPPPPRRKGEEGAG
uniref:Uncharacterized protein n=1 Tax=Oryza meridionalis TaxID=40149 RepID=A0A0E0CMU8_9ORYZ